MGEAGHVELGEEETLLLRHLSCGQHPHFDDDFDDHDDYNVDDEYFELECTFVLFSHHVLSLRSPSLALCGPSMF